jgi:hypothetical protein
VAFSQNTRPIGEVLELGFTKGSACRAKGRQCRHQKPPVNSAFVDFRILDLVQFRLEADTGIRAILGHIWGHLTRPGFIHHPEVLMSVRGSR